MEIPDSVTSIGDSAFYFCDSLTDIEFKGTMAEWEAVDKNPWGWYFGPASEVKCSDGNVSIE